MFVVLATNTNHENTVYGPFKKEEKAVAAAMAMGLEDQLHEFHILPVESPEED